MPFIRTALLGSAGAPVLAEEDYINHFGIVRIMVRGSGVLRPTMYSPDDLSSEILTTITMTSTAQYVKEVKSNFKQQGMSLNLQTTAIDEIFAINKIQIYYKPMWVSMPG